ncbi:TraB/GumN family protein [Candidatus Woesearchaeota archaeon]|nr:TraB/GumN family protein [Candidatus Woesearchaeota archaeon]
MDIKIIGTSHVASQSIREVQEAILDFKPDIVCVELDLPRYHALTSGKREGFSWKDIKYIGIKGFIFALIGAYVEKKLGEKVNVKAGADMLSAIAMAKKLNLKVALIDQPLQVTLRRFSKGMTFKEKWNFFVDLVKGLVFGKKMIREMGLENFDLTKVPGKEVIKKLMLYAKKRYPNLYKVLVEERNAYMANQLKIIDKQNPGAKILAVVGAGHEEGMLKLIREYL